MKLEGNKYHSPMEVVASIKERQLEPIIPQDAPRMHLAVQEEIAVPVLIIRPQNFRAYGVVASAISVQQLLVFNGADQLHLIREPHSVFHGKIEEKQRNSVQFRGDLGQDLGPLVGPIVSYMVGQLLVVFRCADAVDGDLVSPCHVLDEDFAHPGVEVHFLGQVVEEAPEEVVVVVR